MTSKKSPTIDFSSTLIQLNQGQTNRTIERLNQAHIHTLEDLLWIIPLHWNPIPYIEEFGRAVSGQYFKGEGTIIDKGCYYPKPKSCYFWAKVQDAHGPKTMLLKWPHIYPNQKIALEQLRQVKFFGKVSHQLQIVAPTLIHSKEPLIHIQYPTINGAKSTLLKRLFHKIPTSFWSSITDPLPKPIRQKSQLCHLQEAFRIIHGIKLKPEHLNPESFAIAKKRLIYHEFYLEQVKINSTRQTHQKKQAPAFTLSAQKMEQIHSYFPYELTPDQKQSIQEIAHDMQSGTPMIRMLQGDVGCGKTTVAFMSALIANLSGHQAAFMCPTETLAHQHYQKAEPLFRRFNLTCQLLLGSHSLKQKKEALTQIASGQKDFIIGTHALFQDQVQFHSLALSIIDEQHKFGVNQRLKLSHKGYNGHVLTMTATPIPRSLGLTHYGDCDISVIKSLPHNRKKTQTRIITAPLFAKLLSFVATRIDMGEQVYIVTPAIEDSSTCDLTAAKKVFMRFKHFFPQTPMDLLHGRLTPQEKKTAFDHFSQGTTKILISTSIVEVGVDIANASIMIIMNADRFGLSSLHQLRGRVGRSQHPGFCFLVTESQNPKALKRLKVIEQTTDGFAIAEADLTLRGEGDLFGSHQSGKNLRKIANIVKNQNILLTVRDDYQKMLKFDTISL